MGVDRPLLERYVELGHDLLEAKREYVYGNASLLDLAAAVDQLRSRAEDLACEASAVAQEEIEIKARQFAERLAALVAAIREVESEGGPRALEVGVGL